MEPLKLPPPPSVSRATREVTAGVSTALRARMDRILSFRSKVQEEGESVEEYVEELKALAAKCEYTIGVSEIVDQFIYGLRSTAIQDKIYKENGLTVTLKEVIAIATAGEAFQALRFGNQHPLSNDEVQNRLGPYLDNLSLLELRLVSKSCQNFAGVELGTRQKRIIRASRWNPVALGFFELTSSYKICEGRRHYCLKFSSSAQIIKFNAEFGITNVPELPSWPFFGEGIVEFDFDYDENLYGSAKQIISDNYYTAALQFLKMFGAQVVVFIWGYANATFSPSLAQLKTMLSHTPNVRDIWFEGCYSKAENLLRMGTWPDLPRLDSLHCSHANIGWVSEPFILAYGSNITSLNIRKALDITSLIAQHPSVSRDAFLLPCTNVKDLSIRSDVMYIRQLVECTNWKLKRLSLDVYTSTAFNVDLHERTLQDFDNYVTETNLIWDLIDQSSKSLEEVYVHVGGYWEDFVRLFLLPVLHCPVGSVVVCHKVIKLDIPSMYLMRSKQVIQIIRKKFPNIEHIQFIYWEELQDLAIIYGGCEKYYLKYSDYLPRFARDLFFKEFDFPLPITSDRLCRETFVPFLNDLASLKKITVLRGNHASEVLYKVK